MKKLVLAAAIATLSTGAMATPPVPSAPEAIISLSSGAISGVAGEASLSGAGISYQGATAHADNMSFATVGGTQTTGLEKIKLDCPEVNGLYVTKTTELTGSVYTGGETSTSTFGSGTGEALALAGQAGSAALEATVKVKEGDLKATFNIDMGVAQSTGSLSDSVNNGSDSDWSAGEAGLKTASSVTLATLKPSHDYDRRDRDHNEGFQNNPSAILITNSDTSGSLCVDAKCRDISNVAVSLSGSNGAEGEALFVGGSSVEAVYTYNIPKVNIVNGEYNNGHDD